MRLISHYAKCYVLDNSAITLADRNTPGFWPNHFLNYVLMTCVCICYISNQAVQHYFPTLVILFISGRKFVYMFARLDSFCSVSILCWLINDLYMSTIREMKMYVARFAQCSKGLFTFSNL